MAPLALTLPLLIFLGLSLAQAEPIHIPLTHRSRVARAFSPTDEANRLRHKYGFGTAPARRAPQGRRATSSGVPIINQVILALNAPCLPLTIRRIEPRFELPWNNNSGDTVGLAFDPVIVRQSCCAPENPFFATSHFFRNSAGFPLWSLYNEATQYLPLC